MFTVPPDFLNGKKVRQSSVNHASTTIDASWVRYSQCTSRLETTAAGSIAANLIAATRCVAIKKYSDCIFNKAFPMSMDDRREIVVKVPNPNAGAPP